MVPSKFKMGHVTSPRLFQGRFVDHMLGLAMANLCIKIKIPILDALQRYEWRRKMQKFGWLRGLGVTQGRQKHRHLIEHI